jgi:Protein-tyrosine phosphatase
MIVRKVRVRPFDQRDTFRCMFCGGHTCNRCGPLAYLNCTNPVLIGLHSNWITDSILAMARPTNLTNELLDDFISNQIICVFNLTIPGEHPFCGRKDGLLLNTGFTYDPELFMSRCINHFNYSWPDMTTPTINQAIHIVQIALTELNSKDGTGKIAVHCHAGFGRTGIIICCILIAKNGLRGDEAINLVRFKRPGSVQTAQQVEFVHTFERYYLGILNVYDTPSVYNHLDIKISKKTIAESINDQENTLLANEKHNLRYKHKAVVLLCNILSNLLNDYLDDCYSAITGYKLKDIMDGVIVDTPTEIYSDANKLVESIKIQINKNNWSSLTSLLDRSLGKTASEDKVINTRIDANEVHAVVYLLLDWFKERNDILLDIQSIEVAVSALYKLKQCSDRECKHDDKLDTTAIEALDLNLNK